MQWSKFDLSVQLTKVEVKYSNDKYSQEKALPGNQIGLHSILIKYAFPDTEFIIFVLDISNDHADKWFRPEFQGPALS